MEIIAKSQLKSIIARFMVSFILGGVFSYLLLRVFFGNNNILDEANHRIFPLSIIISAYAQSITIDQPDSLVEPPFASYIFDTIAFALLHWFFATIIFFVINIPLRKLPIKYCLIIYNIGVLGIFLFAYLLYIVARN